MKRMGGFDIEFIKINEVLLYEKSHPDFHGEWGGIEYNKVYQFFSHLRKRDFFQLILLPFMLFFF